MARHVTPTIDRWTRLLARILLWVTLGGIVASVVIAFLDADLARGSPLDRGPFANAAILLGFGTFPVVGYILASRIPQNAIGWLMQGIGLMLGIGSITNTYAAYALHGGPGGRDGGLIIAAFDQPMWVPVVLPTLSFLLLLFPNGHLPSPRWRWFARLLAVGYTAIYLLGLFSPEPFDGGDFDGAPNPLGVDALESIVAPALSLLVLIPIGAIGSSVALALRYRRSQGIERLQLRWLVTTAALIAIVFSTVLILSSSSMWGGEQPGWLILLQNWAVTSLGLIPIAIGVSVLRYRLFDLDLVINKALLLGALAVSITLAYVAIVVGVGTLVGSRTSPVLSAVAAAVVALAFQPLRRRAQRLADRLVYGKRATPYEVLSEFSERVGQTYASGELLPRMALALGEGTGAARADVWMRIANELRPSATWPTDAPAIATRPISSADGEASATSMFEPVRHQGELLGALSIEKRPGEPLTATETKLVRGLAAQAGLVLRNVGLTEELLATIEELRASRQRLVSAQDEERRRLERNLHDGAQQQLVALTVKLKLADALVGRDDDRAHAMLADLQAESNQALDDLRDLARGIYPPLLADKGLVAALESQARKSAVPVTIEAEGVRRYAREAEAAVYFSCLEALQNVAKYADASAATVRLSQADGLLAFEVTDDGAGFDPAASSYGTGLQGIADRLAALDGQLEIRSSPGAGTTLRGILHVDS